METKHCPRCDRDLLLSEFTKGSSYCRPCMNEYRREERKRRGHEINARRRERYADPEDDYKEKTQAYAKKYHAEDRRRFKNRVLKTTYGITLEDYERMLKEQDGKCAICFKYKPDEVLAVDHCHNSEKVRGLLCGNCNFMIGHAQDDPLILANGAAYLVRTEREGGG